MRILAVIRQVLDAEESVKLKEGAVDLSSSKLVVDTMDEYGVEQALRLREGGTGIEVVALAIGPARSEEALRTALAMGADRAILVETTEYLDVISVSSVVAQVAQKEGHRPDFLRRSAGRLGLARTRRRHRRTSRLAAGHVDQRAYA